MFNDFDASLGSVAAAVVVVVLIVMPLFFLYGFLCSGKGLVFLGAVIGDDVLVAYFAAFFFDGFAVF